MKKIKALLKPTITIKGCTDKTCRDCQYFGHYNGADDMGCCLFRKQLKEYKDKAYRIEYKDTDGSIQYYNDYARCKECIAAEQI